MIDGEVRPRLGDYDSLVIKPSKDLSIQGRVLVRSMLFDNPRSTVDYFFGEDGAKRINDSVSGVDIENLESKFSKDPAGTLIPALKSLAAIVDDTNLSMDSRKSRVDRYVSSYLDLIVKLDRQAYRGGYNEIIRGVPDYVPDGLSDMGLSPNLNDIQRVQERIRVDKETIFEMTKDFFVNLFLSGEMRSFDKDRTKLHLVELVSDYVRKKINYDHDLTLFGGTLPLGRYLGNGLGVCRHHSLLTQVMIQALGIDIRLLKNDVSFDGGGFGAHASNLVKIGKESYLLDVTNPEVVRGKVVTFMRKVSSEEVDLNHRDYSWKLKDRNGMIRIYKTTRDNYYRLRDNRG